MTPPLDDRSGGQNAPWGGHLGGVRVLGHWNSHEKAPTTLAPLEAIQNLAPQPKKQKKTCRNTLTGNRRRLKRSIGEVARILVHWQRMELQQPPNKFVPIVLPGTFLFFIRIQNFVFFFCKSDFIAPLCHFLTKYRQESHDIILVRV